MYIFYILYKIHLPSCCAEWTCVVLGVVINIPLTDMMTRDGKSKTLSLDSLVSKLTGENKSIVLVIVEEFRKMKTEFLDTITERNQEVDSLKNDVKELRAKVSELEQCVDQADAYERLDTIIISGGSVPAFTNGENCSTILKDLIKNKLHLEISSSDINTAHRLGKKPTSQAVDKRNLIVKLCRRDIKRAIIQAARNNKDSNLFINESLTPLRRSIFYALRQIRKAHPNLIRGCATFDGKVHAYVKPSPTAPDQARNERIPINTRERLELLCRDYVKQPLENFLTTWSH